MKRPYLSQHERQLILLGTLVGDHKNVRLKAKLLARSIKRAFFKPTQRKVPLPDESDVIGKDLPVGYKFLKDGKVVEVVSSYYCGLCVFSRNVQQTLGSCYGVRPVCHKHKRKDGIPVAFLYVEQ